MTLLGIISVDFDGTCQLLTVCAAFITNWRSNGSRFWQIISYLWTSSKTIDSVKIEV
jgi:hypothetical protein